MSFSLNRKLALAAIIATMSNQVMAGDFRIKLVLDEKSLPLPYHQHFEEAAKRWEKMIEGVGRLPEHTLVIKAKAENIDGIDGILGESLPTKMEMRTNMPLEGEMSFDLADLTAMKKNGTLNNTITHEIGHILGIGVDKVNDVTTRWGKQTDMIVEENPVFIGKMAMKVYKKMAYAPSPLRVPLENMGDEGTYGSHWREEVFGNELMTGYSNDSTDPISRLTLAALEDLGYIVNYEAAEHYRLPVPVEIEEAKQKSNDLKESQKRTARRIRAQRAKEKEEIAYLASQMSLIPPLRYPPPTPQNGRKASPPLKFKW